MGNIGIYTIPVVTLNSTNTLKTVTNEAVKWKEFYLLEYVCCKCVFYFRTECIASMTWTASFLEFFNSVKGCKDRNVKGTRTFGKRSIVFPPPPPPPPPPPQFHCFPSSSSSSSILLLSLLVLLLDSIVLSPPPSPPPPQFYCSPSSSSSIILF